MPDMKITLNEIIELREKATRGEWAQGNPTGITGRATGYFMALSDWKKSEVFFEKHIAHPEDHTSIAVAYKPNDAAFISRIHDIADFAISQAQEVERLKEYIEKNRDVLKQCTCSAPFTYAKETCAIHGTREESPWHPN